MIDISLRGFGDGRTDKWTDGQTIKQSLVIIKWFLWLKTNKLDTHWFQNKWLGGTCFCLLWKYTNYTTIHNCRWQYTRCWSIRSCRQRQHLAVKLKYQEQTTLSGNMHLISEGMLSQKKWGQKERLVNSNGIFKNTKIQNVLRWFSIWILCREEAMYDQHKAGELRRKRSLEWDMMKQELDSITINYTHFRY